MLTIRVGVPLTGGRMMDFFKENPTYPMLMSANAFFGWTKDGERKLNRFKIPPGLDIALDSAGFVAMSKYGQYPWTEEQYLELAGLYDWAWFSTPDYCVEKEVAGNRDTVRLRMSATIAAYYRVAAKAARIGLPNPIPILQGTTYEDYKYCAQQLPCDGIVGLGSFCRRDVDGPDGIVSIVQRLSEDFPNARWHGFGVKGTALSSLGSIPSMFSCDSMAWDFQARTERRTGRSIEFRLGVMQDWLATNRSRVLASAWSNPRTDQEQGTSASAGSDQVAAEDLPANSAAPGSLVPVHSSIGSACTQAEAKVDSDVFEEDDVESWLELVESGVLTLEQATAHMQQCCVGWSRLAMSSGAAVL